jgi:hypothetical protein
MEIKTIEIAVHIFIYKLQNYTLVSAEGTPTCSSAYPVSCSSGRRKIVSVFDSRKLKTTKQLLCTYSFTNYRTILSAEGTRTCCCAYSVQQQENCERFYSRELKTTAIAVRVFVYKLQNHTC